MGVLDERRDDLERYEFMMGVPRGRLAVTLDLLTDALAFVGQHGVYCQSALRPDTPQDGHPHHHAEHHRRQRTDPERDGGIREAKTSR